MPDSFSCPHCGATCDVADDRAGGPVQCGQCGKAVEASGGVEPERVSGPPKSSAAGALWVLGGGFAAFVAIIFLLPAIQASRSSRRAPCINRLKELGLAMHNYHSVHHCFPPAYLADENGKPMHSWRVLLLPYMEQKTLYSKYDFDEPWNGPNNIQWADYFLRAYHCPGDNESGNPRMTSCVMIVGPGMISDGTSATTIEQMTDGATNTILLVEVSNSGIAWSEPRDLDARELALGVNARRDAGVRSGHGLVANALFCDGSVHSLDNDLPPQLLEALATIAGGEDVSEF